MLGMFRVGKRRGRGGGKQTVKPPFVDLNYFGVSFRFMF